MVYNFNILLQKDSMMLKLNTLIWVSLSNLIVLFTGPFKAFINTFEYFYLVYKKTNYIRNNGCRNVNDIEIKVKIYYVFIDQWVYTRTVILNQ